MGTEPNTEALEPHPTESVQLEAKDIPALRDRLLKEQGGVCAICGKVPDVPCLDHEHGKRFGGSKKIRGSICRGCNSAEGRTVNAIKRIGVKIQDIPDWLESLAKYLRKDHYQYIHPTEKTVVKINKTTFKALMVKYLEKYPKKKALVYPKNGKASKRLQEIIKELE